MLFLREDLLVKAEGDAGAPPALPTPVGGAGGPDLGSPGGEQYQPCSLGGGPNCAAGGGSGTPDAKHKVGGATERKHSEWQASQGAGAAPTETAVPEAEMSPDRAREKATKHASATNTLDPKGTQGTTSTDPSAYPEDSDPVDHYRVAEAAVAIGGGNDSSKQIAEGHKKIARQRSEHLSPEEHEGLASQLREHGLHDDADHHEKTAGEGRAVQEERLGEDFDQMMGDTADVPAKLDQQDEFVKVVEKVGKDVESEVARKEQLKEDDPYALANEDWEAGKAAAEDKHKQAVEDFKAGVDKKHEATVDKHKASVDKDHEKATRDYDKQFWADRKGHADAMVAHKEKVDKDYDAKHKDWSDKSKEHKVFEGLAENHKQREPEKPKPYIGDRPKVKDYNMPVQSEKFEKDVAEHEKSKGAYKKEQAKYKAQKHAHGAEGLALKKQRPSKTGKEPKRPSYKKGAPTQPKPVPPPKHPGYKKDAPKHPGYKKGEPTQPEQKDAPKAEDFDMKKPSSAPEKAQHAEYTQAAKASRENLQSHLENNPDLSPEEKGKLQATHEALAPHADSDRMPTKEQASEAKKMGSVAGKHGKAAYESPEDTAAKKDAASAAKSEEAPRSPETDIEKIQHADHKTKAQDMRTNIESHMQALEADESMSPDQRADTIDRLNQIHQTLEAHTQLTHLPTSEQDGEMKELTKLAGEHGKKPAEADDTDGGKASKRAAAAKGPAVNYSVKFKAGMGRGQAAARAALSGDAGELAPQALGLGAEGVVAAGDNLLHKPAARAADQRKKQSDLDAKAAEKTGKKQAAAQAKEAAVKGLYLDLGADLDLIKAVTSPNVGNVTESGKRSQRKMKESYAKQPVGVMGGAGIAMPDDPDVGDKWQHDEDDSVDTELETKVRNQDKDEEDTEKSVAVVLLKSLRIETEEQIAIYRHNPTEVVFMCDVLGYTEQDIRKGLVRITGRDRHRFHEWMLERMCTSVDSMMGSVNLG